MLILILCSGDEKSALNEKGASQLTCRLAAKEKQEHYQMGRIRFIVCMYVTRADGHMGSSYLFTTRRYLFSSSHRNLSRENACTSARLVSDTGHLE